MQMLARLSTQVPIFQNLQSLNFLQEFIRISATTRLVTPFPGLPERPFALQGAISLIPFSDPPAMTF